MFLQCASAALTMTKANRVISVCCQSNGNSSWIGAVQSIVVRFPNCDGSPLDWLPRGSQISRNLRLQAHGRLLFRTTLALTSDCHCHPSMAGGKTPGHQPLMLSQVSTISGLSYLCTRPEPSPDISFSTSGTVTRLKSPRIVCFSALAATANSRLCWRSSYALRP